MTKRKISFTCTGCHETFPRPEGLTRSPIYHSTECQFWSKVNKTEYCWYWIGSCHQFGYGEFRSGHKFHRAHRYSYELHKGAIEDGLGINHKCDNPKCVNPEHLYAGTQQQNTADALERNRVHRKLSIEDATTIKKLLSEGHTPFKISKLYNISPSTINNIKVGTAWNWVKV